MGESKRRKALDPSYGKPRIITVADQPDLAPLVANDYYEVPSVGDITTLIDKTDGTTILFDSWNKTITIGDSQWTIDGFADWLQAEVDGGRWTRSRVARLSELLSQVLTLSVALLSRR